VVDPVAFSVAAWHLHPERERVYDSAPALSTKELRRVRHRRAVGNVIEWYDFYIFGSLARSLRQFSRRATPWPRSQHGSRIFSVGF